MSEEKKAIRERALKFRNSIEKHPDHAGNAARIFFDSVKPSPSQKVALYFPLPDELDTMNIVDGLWEMGSTCLLPIIPGDGLRMQFARWEKGTKLVNGKYDIPTPQDPEFLRPDIVVVPVVAFDQKGNRMGHGKGYYDATIRSLRETGDILTVGLAFAEQAVLFGLPTEAHDQKLDMMVTPQRFFDFRA